MEQATMSAGELPPSPGSETTVEGSEQSQPWQGEATQLYLPDEEREELRGSIMETVQRRKLKTSDLAEEIARDAYDEETGTVPYTTGDVAREISRMWRSSLQLGEGNCLYRKK